MVNLPAILLVAAIAADPGSTDPRSAVVEENGVRIETTVRSQKFAWTVTNVDAPPIMRFEIAHFHAYNLLAPDGWEVEGSGLQFDAWTDDIGVAIRPGRSGVFRGTVSSHGGELGVTPVTIGVHGGERRTVSAVWTSIAPRLSVRFTLLATLFAIILGHAAIVARRDRRRAAPAATSA